MMLISFVIIAKNEENSISSCINSIINSCTVISENYEIVVVDDSSIDGTAEVSKKLGALVFHVDNNNIAKNRNVGASHSCGDIIFFVDADTNVTSELLKSSLLAISNGYVAGGSSRVLFIEDIKSIRKDIQIFFYKLANKISLINGCYMFCQKDLFFSVMFDEHFLAFEDYNFFWRIRSHKIHKSEIPVYTSGRKITHCNFFDDMCYLFGAMLNGLFKINSAFLLRKLYCRKESCNQAEIL